MSPLTVQSLDALRTFVVLYAAFRALHGMKIGLPLGVAATLLVAQFLAGHTPPPELLALVHAPAGTGVDAADMTMTLGTLGGAFVAIVARICWILHSMNAKTARPALG